MSNSNVERKVEQVKVISNEIALLMFRHGMDLKTLAEFISLNPKDIAYQLSKKHKHRKYLDHRKQVRRELLRRHWNGETYKEICVDLDVNIMSASELKIGEMERIREICHESSPSIQTLESTILTLADEYGLNANDIIAIYEDREERRLQREAIWERDEAERDAMHYERMGFDPDC